MTIDERISAELRRQAPEVDEHAAWVRIQSLAPVTGRNRAMRLVPISAAALGSLLLGFVLFSTLSAGPAPASDPRSPFEDTWVSTTDADGSTQTMTIEVSGDGTVDITVLDDFASVCSGAPSTMTGTGRLEDSTKLVIPAPSYICDDGSVAEALSGPPLSEQLRDLTFVHDPVSDILSDNLGSIWGRLSAQNQGPEPTISDSMWPQSSLDEIREAQGLADAGDPRYTWQLDPELVASQDMALYDAEFFTRFLREELGWKEFRGIPGMNFGQGSFSKVDFVRCASDRTNPLYPNDPRGGGCAPTIDEVHYETVRIDVAQLDRQGPTGIWVVSRWAMIESMEQVVPPDPALLVGTFLQARIEGEGVQEYLDVPEHEVPFMYATNTGAPYERFEFEVLEGPVWPYGEMSFKVRLFAEAGETVVEQFFSKERGDLGLQYVSAVWGPAGQGPATTVNGQAVPVPYNFVDAVIFHAAFPWYHDWPDPSSRLINDNLGGMVVLVADPRPIGTGCQEGPAPANAEALAESIQSDPDLEATTPVSANVGGNPALRMEVVAAPGASVCEDWESPQVITANPLDWHGVDLDQGSRMRLYLLDLPEGSGRILAIAIVAPEASFDDVVEAAAPIVDSLEFDAG